MKLKKWYHVYPKDQTERPYGFSTVNSTIRDHPDYSFCGIAVERIKNYLHETAASVVFVASNNIP